MSEPKQLGPHHWSLETPAKLNLFLELLAKRPDGYHELETVMAPIDWYDTLTVRIDPNSAPGWRFNCDHSAIDAQAELNDPTKNLSFRAAERLLGNRPLPGLVTLELTKQIPLQAGLGGGSSDAAGTLRLLNKALNLQVSSGELREIAAALGSDTVFFLDPQPAVCRGRGEIPIPIGGVGRLHCLVIRPAFGLSTATVFRGARIPTEPRVVEPLLNAWRRGELPCHAELLYNALEEPALCAAPELATVLHELRRCGAVSARVTGSGSCCFGLFADHESAESARSAYCGPAAETRVVAVG